MKNNLKTIISVILICSVLLACLYSCKKDEDISNSGDKSNDLETLAADAVCTSKEIADAIIEVYGEDEIPQTKMMYYLSGADEESENYRSPEQLGLLATGTPEIPADFEFIEDYAFFVPMGQDVFEIAVVKYKDKEKNTGSGIIESRLERKKSMRGDTERYKAQDLPILDGAKIITADKYTILLATTDNAKAEAAILALFKSGGGNRTTLPEVSVSKYNHNTSYLLGGKCEPGAMIRVTGGAEEVYTGSDFGDFLVEVPFSGESVLKLTAESKGKEPSKEIEFAVSRQEDVKTELIIGNNYRVFPADCAPNFMGEDIIAESGIAALTKRAEKRLDMLKSKGVNAEMIFLIIPNPARIYPEDMPELYPEYKRDTLKRQWTEGVTAAGVTVIDLLDVMLEHKNDEFKIWHKTDSHWSEYGAYLGYVELMNHIAKKYPDAAPRPSSDFEFYNKEVYSGDIYHNLGLDPTDLKETTSFAKFNFDPPHFNPEYKAGHISVYRDDDSAEPVNERVSFDHVTNSNVSGNLPSVYIARDSFEVALHAYYTDRFSTATFQHMWVFGWFDTNAVVNCNPDYIIYVINERNIKDAFFN